MSYKDPEKQKEYQREKQKKYRERRSNAVVTPGEVVTPTSTNKVVTRPAEVVTRTPLPLEGMEPHLAQSWRSVAELQASDPDKLRRIVAGVVEKGHGNVVWWGCFGPSFNQIAEVFLGMHPKGEDYGVPYGEPTFPVVVPVRRKSELVISQLPDEQVHSLYTRLHHAPVAW